MQLLKLALANIGWGETVRPLSNLADYLGAGGIRQVGQFAKGILQLPRMGAALYFYRDQDSFLRLQAGGNGPSRYGVSLLWALVFARFPAAGILSLPARREW